MCKDMEWVANKRTITHVLATIRDICNSCERCKYCPFDDMCNTIYHEETFIPGEKINREYMENAINKYFKGGKIK